MASEIVWRRARCCERALAGGSGLALLLGVAPAWAQTQLDADLRLRADHFERRAEAGGSTAEIALRGQTEIAAGTLAGRLEARRFNFDGATQDDVLLREASWSLRRDAWRVSAGRLLRVWGRADGFRVLDVLVPLDVPDVFYEDAERSRRGAWAAEIEHAGEAGEFSLWLSPDNALNRVVPAGNDLPNYPKRATSDDAPPLTAALRWGGRAGPVDWSLHGFSGLWRDPILSLAGSEPQWRAARTRLAGVSFDWPVATVVLRGEAAVMDHDAAQPHTPLPRARALLGADVDLDGVLLSPQLYAERAAEAPGTAERWQASASLLVDARTLQDRLHLRYFGIVGDEGRSRWHSLRIGWQAGERWEWRLAADHFDGEPGSRLGAFAARSRVSLELVAHFGLAGDRISPR